MKFLHYSLICILPLALCAKPAWAQQNTRAGQVSAVGKDPSSLYLEAWFCMEDADKLYKNEDYLAAVKKAQRAEAILAAIARDHPDWQKNMVSVRRQTNTNNMTRWAQLAKTNPAKQVQPDQSTLEKGGTAIAVGDPGPQPGNREIPGFDELEQRRRQARSLQAEPSGPRMAATPPSYSEPRGPYQQLESELLKREFENKALVQALKDTQRKLIDAMAEKNKAATGQSVYKEKYEELAAQLVKERAQDSKLIEALTKKFNEVEAELKKAVDKNEEADRKIAQLQAQIEQTNALLAKVTRERDSLKTERDELAAIVEFNSPEKTKILLDNNLTLAHKLKEAQEKIARLEEDKTEGGNQIAANIKELEETRTEVTRIKVMLAAIRDENIGYRRRISELNTKLVNAEAELDKLSKQPDADPAALEENRLLRSAISKQMMVLTTQQKGRDLLIEEFRKLNIDNPEIDAALTLLEDEEQLELTDAEKALVKSFAATPEEGTETAPNATISSMGDTVRKQLELEAIGRLASRTFDQGDYAAAEQLYKTLLQDQPNHYAARVNLGTILIKRDLVDEAIEHLKRASELAPDTAPVCYMLGVAYYRKGADKEAAEAFRQTTVLEPDNVDAYYYMGNIESTAGNYDQAVAYYDNALKIKPNLPDVLFNKAATLADAGKILDARKAYDLAIQAGAAPDLALQQVLDPNSNAAPVLVRNNEQPQPAPAADDSSGKEQPAIATVDPLPRNSEPKDASIIPGDDREQPQAQVQLVANKQPEQIKLPAETKPESSSVGGEAKSPAPDKEESTVKGKPVAPKNKRWFRFG